MKFNELVEDWLTEKATEPHTKTCVDVAVRKYNDYTLTYDSYMDLRKIDVNLDKVKTKMKELETDMMAQKEVVASVLQKNFFLDLAEHLIQVTRKNQEAEDSQWVKKWIKSWTYLTIYY